VRPITPGRRSLPLPVSLLLGRRWLACGIALSVAVLAGCSNGGGNASPPEETRPPDDALEPDPAPVAAEPSGDPADCPTGFDQDPLAAGLHDGFASGGQDRGFHLLLPEDPSEPAPLFVSLTGTVQEEVAFMEQSRIYELPAQGWVVVAPVRNDNGLVWGPWDAMRTPTMAGPNPDSAFVLDLVDCISGHHPVDRGRVFVGGVSIGGTMVNHLLRHHPEVFAGGIVGSGNFVLTAPAEPQPLGDMTVIVAWGGDDDRWTGCPDGRMGPELAGEPGCVSADFVEDARAASEFYAEEGVRLLACREDVGHIWISSATSWWAEVLAASPKGTDEPLDPGAAPPPMECSAGPPEPA